MKGFRCFLNGNMTKQNKASMAFLSWAISWPPCNGGDKRLVSLIEAFLANNWEVHGIFLAREFTPEQKTGWYALKNMGVKSIKERTIGRVDHYFGKLLKGFGEKPFGFPAAFSPLLRNWICRQMINSNSRVILTNHLNFFPLVTNRLGRHSVIDCVDIHTANKSQVSGIASCFPLHGWDLPQPSDLVIDESCFDRCPSPSDLNKEMELLAQFDSILAISSAEAETIKSWIKGAQVETIPMCVDPVSMDNSYAGPALFVGHNHPFNAQGYAYFVVRVLPLVLQQEPDFIFRVIGNDTTRFPAHPSADIRGFVDDIQSQYREAPFLLVPILGGTGQLTRIVEAMAHGLPVIATRAAARSSPIRHGINGFIAADAAEMACHVIALHRDRKLARTMGNAARETVRAEFTMGHLRARVARIFGRG